MKTEELEMSRQIDLGEEFRVALQQLEQLEKVKVDVMKKPSDIHVTDDGVYINGMGNVGFTKTGLQSLGQKFDIPSSQLDKLMDDEIKGKPKSEQRKLLDRTILKMLLERGIEQLKEDKEILFRTYNQNGEYLVRGVFSDRYGYADNLPIMRELQKFDGYNMKAQNFRVNSDHMDIRFSLPDLKRSLGKLPEREIRFGMTEDIVFPAVHVRNSEVGRSNATIMFVIYRLVCKNGLTHERDQFTVINRKHLGEIDLSQLTDGLNDLSKRIPDMFERYVEAITTAKETRYDDTTERILLLNRRNGITKRMTNVVRDNWEKEQGREESKFALINAITAGARDWEKEYDDFSGRLTLEQTAGELLFVK